MKMKTWKCWGLCASAALLSACGSSDSDMVVRLNGMETITAGEQDKVSVQTPHDILSVKNVGSEERISLTFEGATINVSVSDLQWPALKQFDVVMKGDNQILIQRYEAVGVNTSALDSEDMAYDIKDRYQDLLGLGVDREVYRFFIDLAYLNEIILPSERDARIDLFDAKVSPYYAVTQQAFDELLQIFDQYLDGEVGETTLRAYASSASDALQSHGEYGLTQLRAAEDVSTLFIDPLPSTGIRFSDTRRTFSRYFEPSMLQTDPGTGAVSYLPEYQMLTPLTGL